MQTGIPRQSAVRQVVVAMVLAAACSGGKVFAQTLIYNRTNGSNLSLFELTNGVSRQLNTGLQTNLFPSVSRDGRFVLISGADPQAPNEASGDLFEYDRTTGQRRRVINNSTTTRPDGTVNFSTPMFTTRSSSNQLIAVTTQLGSIPGGGNPRTLTVHRASDGFQVGLAEIGNGNAFDFTQSEFTGLSWQPNGNVFAAPGYVNVTTNTGRPTLSTGIVLYGPTSSGYGRVGQVTTPIVVDGFGTISQETHVMPTYSPSGQKLAYFSVTYPNALLNTPASAALFTVNANGSGRTSLVNFIPGLFPLGLSWTPDGTQLVFSMGNQSFGGGIFSPTGDAATAFLRGINATGGTPFAIAGAPNGLFPSVIVSSSTTSSDLNGDGGVDAADAGIMFASWARSGAGDLNRDNIVDAADAGILFADWTGDAVTSVPEPTSYCLLQGISLVWLLRRNARTQVTCSTTAIR